MTLRKKCDVIPDVRESTETAGTRHDEAVDSSRSQHLALVVPQDARVCFLVLSSQNEANLRRRPRALPLSRPHDDLVQVVMTRVVVQQSSGSRLLHANVHKSQLI